ncbi:MAG: hypothetical protein IJ039_05845 [Clostridia bacterium]|nr:hypothetical protein [Clostridia bacterium]
MKKFLLILMAILLAFSLIACDEENIDNQNPTSNSSNGDVNDAPNDDENVNKDENGTTGGSQNGSQNGSQDGSQDGNGDENQDDNEKPNLQETAGIVLTNAVMSQLEEAASLKIEFTLDLTYSDNSWVLSETGEDAENVIDGGHGIAKFVMTVAKSDYGYDVKVEADVQSKDSPDGEYETDLSGTVYYVVDGVVYEYAEAFDAYLVSYAQSIDTAQLEAMLGMIIEEAGLTEEQINAVLNEIGMMFIEAFQISNNKGSSYVDFKPMIDAFTAYVNSIDPEKTTIEDILNDMLALAGEGVTVEVLLAGVEDLYQMTLEEYLAFLDAGLQESCEMTLQETYEYIVNNENVQMLLLSLVYEMVGEEATEEDIEAMLDMIMSFSFEEDIPAEYKSMTMYDLIVGFMYSSLSQSTGQEQTPPTIEETMAMVNAMLDMTLIDVQTEFGVPVEQLLSIVNMFEISEFNSKIDLSFKGIFEIESIVSETKFGITVNTPSEVEGKTDVVVLNATVTFKLYSISTKVIKINEPDDKDYIENIFNVECQIFDESGSVEVTYDDAGVITVTVRGGGAEETYQITLNDIIDGNTIVIGDNMIVLYPEMEYAEILSADEICEHTYSAWEMDEWGDMYRVCVVCGEYEYNS